MCKNFSTLPNSCRKCLCQVFDLHKANEYSDISGKNHVPRNDQMMQNDYLESKELGVKHINGVCNQSLFHEFPYFETSTMLPQCSSHDYLGFIHRLRNRISIHDSQFYQKIKCSSKNREI